MQRYGFFIIGLVFFYTFSQLARPTKLTTQEIIENLERGRQEEIKTMILSTAFNQPIINKVNIEKYLLIKKITQKFTGKKFFRAQFSRRLFNWSPYQKKQKELEQEELALMRALRPTSFLHIDTDSHSQETYSDPTELFGYFSYPTGPKPYRLKDNEPS